MYARSAAFDAAVKKSHLAIFKCEIYDNGILQRTLDIGEGNVRVEDAAVRRRFDARLVDPDGTLTPDDASDLLAPFGNEIKIYRGIRFDSGTEEYLSLGVFGLDDIKIDDSGETLGLTIEGYDRAHKVQKAKFVTEYVVASGTNYATAIQDLILSRFPAAQFNFISTTRTTPKLVFEAGSDPWEAARKMAGNIGCDLFFDTSGICKLVAIVDPTTASVDWRYAEGAEAMFLYINKRMTNEGVYNHVIVTGESTENTSGPVRAEAKDDNPASPTYYLGDFGDVVYFQASEFITTQSQAQDVANARLQKVLGASEEVRILNVPHPAHEIDDVIEIVRAKSKIDARYVIDGLTIPLVEQRGMDISTRKRKV